MRFICENRNDKLYVRGKCCINRQTGELREDYSGWIIKDIDISNPNVLADEDGRLLYRVMPDNSAIREPSDLTPKEQAVKDKPTYDELIQRVKNLENAIAKDIGVS